GGLIYLAIKADAASADVLFRFKNAIQAPYYRYQKTTIQDWQQQLRNNRAPWGEIASEKIIITLPDSALQKIPDTGKLLKVWDEVVSTANELAQVESPFVRPLRIVIDEQTSVGFMHSGYPIMAENSPS